MQVPNHTHTLTLLSTFSRAPNIPVYTPHPPTHHTQHPLTTPIPQSTHSPGTIIWKYFYGLLIDLSRLNYTKEFCRSLQVDVEHLHARTHTHHKRQTRENRVMIGFKRTPIDKNVVVFFKNKVEVTLRVPIKHIYFLSRQK